MRKRTKVMIVGASVLALGAGGASYAVATSEDNAQSISGPALDRARTAALAHTAGGQVTGTEVGDEESYYEVEVTQPDGSQADVQLDRGFDVVGSSADHEDSNSRAAAPAPILSGAGPGWPKRLAPSDFVRRVDNPWFPLRPGSSYRYRGVKEGVPMVDVVRIAHGTKLILGVRTTVVHDTVLVHGRPEEETFDYYAQDRRGNVWYFGEDTKELDPHGNVISREGSFRAGRNGARAGLYFPGDPRVGVSARQEFFKGHAEDHFRVIDLHGPVSVPYVTTQRSLRTREWTPLEPAVVDNKYYVRGVGTVREVAVRGPVERLRLITFHRG